MRAETESPHCGKYVLDIALKGSHILGCILETVGERRLNLNKDHDEQLEVP